MENIRDWCISRQLWFGHRIPAWYVRLSEGASSPPGGPSETMDMWVVGRDEGQAHEAASARFPGQQYTLQQVRACWAMFVDS